MDQKINSLSMIKPNVKEQLGYVWRHQTGKTKLNDTYKIYS